MTNTSNEVRDFLNKNPYIVKGLKEGIVNVRGLSFYFLKKTRSNASLDAIMTAIRRYQQDIEVKGKKETVSEIFKESRISTKSRLIMIEIGRHFRILRNVLPSILDAIHVSKGEVLRIIEGRESMMLVIDQFKKKEILSLIPKEELIDVKENLGEINIHTSEKLGDMPGILAPIINELSLNDVNLIEIIGGYPEIVIIIKEDEISKCHDVLLRLFYGK